MLSSLPHRHQATRLPIAGHMSIPMLSHRNGHDHRIRTIALASWGAGVVVGTAAGALLFSGRHPSTAEQMPAEARAE